MLFIKKYISSIITAVVVLTAVLGFFSPMYAYQEGLSIFMSGGDFFADTCLRPGGMSDYIGVFLAQYFMYPHWLSIILVALVVGTQLIAKSIIIKNTNDKLADVLSVICAAGMLAAVAEFNIIFGGCVAVILALAAVKNSRHDPKHYHSVGYYSDCILGYGRLVLHCIHNRCGIVVSNQKSRNFCSHQCSNIVDCLAVYKKNNARRQPYRYIRRRGFQPLSQ